MGIFDEDLGQKLAATASAERGMVTGMVAIVEFIDEDGEQKVSWAVAPGQKVTTSAGLLALADSLTEFELRAYVGEMYRSDDE